MRKASSRIRFARLTALFLAVLAIAAPVQVFARGGGGGGGHASSSPTTVMVPIFIPTQAQMPTQAGDTSRIHTVAVLSALGPNLTLRNEHFLGPKTSQFDISGWAIDDEVNMLMKRYLHDRFAFKDVLYDRAVLNAIPNGVWDTQSGFSKYLRTVPNEGIDAFIVVRRDLVLQAPGIEGLALQNGLGDKPIVWANYEIDVIDARTYTTISSAYSRIRLRGGTTAAFAGLEGPKQLIVGDDFALSDVQRAILHAFVDKIVDTSLIETLRALNLGVALPEAGARTLVPIPADKKPYKTVNAIGLVSAIGDELEMEHQGFLSHDKHGMPVNDWQIDARMENDIRAALDKRFTVRPVTLDRNALYDTHILDSGNKIATLFPGLKPTPDVDAYLVAMKISIYPALGIFNWNPVAGEPGTKVYANYVLVLLDAHTLKILSLYPGTRTPDHPSAQPSEMVGNDLWPDAPPALSPNQATQIRLTLERLIDETVPETLMHMGLTGMMPAGGAPPAPGTTLAAQPAAEPANQPGTAAQ
jgi:hypothetical protein